jgi:hypothetical protein
MTVTVNDDTLKQTECDNDFSCLSEDYRFPCKAVSRSGEDRVLTTCGGDRPSCKYCMPIGRTGGYCLCPTRVALFGRHEM